MSSISKARVRRSSSWDLVRRDGVQGMGDSTFYCQAENAEVNIPELLKQEITSELVRYVGIICQDSGFSHGNDVHYFAVDHEGLIDDIYSLGSSFGLSGRQDATAGRQFKLPGNFLDDLAQLTNGSIHKDFIADVFKKKFWVLFTDNALSGTSVCNEIDRLKILIN